MFVFTSCTNNYIPKARILASTLKKFHPDWTFCLLLGEEPPKNFSLAKEPFDRLVTFDQLHIPNFQSWLFRHRVVEVCTAAKGPALFHFLIREGLEKVMYLDPDIMVCNTLDPLNDLLDNHDILLTPHQLAPQETQQSIVDNEICALQHGVFNLGFVAVAQRGDGIGFTRWWRDRLLQYCYDDIPRGIFTDQRWCDLAPAFFPNLHIIRDPGYNAASWNLTDRVITRAEDGTFLANALPLRFYHFTGFDSGSGDGMTERYAKDMPAVHELWTIYRQQLVKYDHATLGNQKWKYINFNDGTFITDAMRLLYREREDVQEVFPDPFRRPGFLDWYLSECRRSNFFHRKISPLWRKMQHVLQQHGGFPKGIPGLVWQIRDWIGKWGIVGILRKVWHIAPDNSLQPSSLTKEYIEDLPKLTNVLNDEEHFGHRLMNSIKECVCIIEHDWGGGAEDYCQDRIEQLLEKQYSLIRLRYAMNAMRLEMAICYDSAVFRCKLDDIRELADPRFPRISRIIINELAGWYHRPGDQTYTVNSVLDAVTGLIDIIRYHGAQTEFLFHDYYPVCPTVNLLNLKQAYCGLNNELTYCDTCGLRGKTFSMKKWRTVWGELLAIIDEVVFFSEHTRNTVCSLYPLREKNIHVRPHIVQSLGEPLCIPEQGPMKIAVVGNIQMHKGANIVLELARLLHKHNAEATVFVFGNLETGSIPSNITVLGPYKKSELAGLLQQHNVTVGFFPSICPETFSFVVHELTSLELPLVCFNLGAQGDYVRTLSNSRVVSEISAEAALKALQELDALRTLQRTS